MSCPQLAIGSLFQLQAYWGRSQSLASFAATGREAHNFSYESFLIKRTSTWRSFSILPSSLHFVQPGCIRTCSKINGLCCEATGTWNAAWHLRTAVSGEARRMPFCEGWYRNFLSVRIGGGSFRSFRAFLGRSAEPDHEAGKGRDNEKRGTAGKPHPALQPQERGFFAHMPLCRGGTVGKAASAREGDPSMQLRHEKRRQREDEEVGLAWLTPYRTWYGEQCLRTIVYLPLGRRSSVDRKLQLQLQLTAVKSVTEGWETCDRGLQHRVKSLLQRRLSVFTTASAKASHVGEGRAFPQPCEILRMYSRWGSSGVCVCPRS